MAGTGTAHLRDPDSAVLRVEDLVVEFASGSQTVRAVSGVSFDVLAGETVGLVGESGCGKSTIAAAAAHLVAPRSGSITLAGRRVDGHTAEEVRASRKTLQLTFQSPVASLNPRRRAGEIVREPLRIWGIGSKADQARAVEEAFAAVGLDFEAFKDRRPGQMSGGQCQRLTIARALTLEPKVLICDEPTASLDVSVQSQILNLLRDVGRARSMALVFISHDMAAVKNIAHRVLVMYLGKVCEVAPTETLFAEPRHPYTHLLFSAVPRASEAFEPEPTRRPAGEMPSPLDPPSGCRYRTRCPRADLLCTEVEPTLTRVSDDHFVACHHPLERHSAPAASERGGE